MLRGGDEMKRIAIIGGLTAVIACGIEMPASALVANDAARGFAVQTGKIVVSGQSASEKAVAEQNAAIEYATRAFSENWDRSAMAAQRDIQFRQEVAADPKKILYLAAAQQVGRFFGNAGSERQQAQTKTATAPTGSTDGRVASFVVAPADTNADQKFYVKTHIMPAYPIKNDPVYVQVEIFAFQPGGAQNYAPAQILIDGTSVAVKPIGYASSSVIRYATGWQQIESAAPWGMNQRHTVAVVAKDSRTYLKGRVEFTAEEINGLRTSDSSKSGADYGNLCTDGNCIGAVQANANKLIMNNQQGMSLPTIVGIIIDVHEQDGRAVIRIRDKNGDEINVIANKGAAGIFKAGQEIGVRGRTVDNNGSVAIEAEDIGKPEDVLKRAEGKKGAAGDDIQSQWDKAAHDMDEQTKNAIASMGGGDAGGGGIGAGSSGSTGSGGAPDGWPSPPEKKLLMPPVAVDETTPGYAAAGAILRAVAVGLGTAAGAAALVALAGMSAAVIVPTATVAAVVSLAVAAWGAPPGDVRAFFSSGLRAPFSMLGHYAAAHAVDLATESAVAFGLAAVVGPIAGVAGRMIASSGRSISGALPAVGRLVENVGSMAQRFFGVNKLRDAGVVDSLSRQAQYNNALRNGLEELVESDAATSGSALRDRLSGMRPTQVRQKAGRYLEDPERVAEYDEAKTVLDYLGDRSVMPREPMTAFKPEPSGPATLERREIVKMFEEVQEVAKRFDQAAENIAKRSGRRPDFRMTDKSTVGLNGLDALNQIINKGK